MYAAQRKRIESIIGITLRVLVPRLFSARHPDQMRMVVLMLNICKFSQPVSVYELNYTYTYQNRQEHKLSDARSLTWFGVQGARVGVRLGW